MKNTPKTTIKNLQLERTSCHNRAGTRMIKKKSKYMRKKTIHIMQIQQRDNGKKRLKKRLKDEETTNISQRKPDVTKRKANPVTQSGKLNNGLIK